MARHLRLDVGIVTWNTAELTCSAIARLLGVAASSPTLELRVLVHDNASSDDTVERLAREVPEAEVVAGTQNLGFAAGVNRLLARSDAPWFLALNSDAWPEPGALEALLEAAIAHPRAGLVVPRLEQPDGTLEHSCFPFPSLRVAALTAVGGYRWLAPGLSERWCLPGAFDHRQARPVPWAVGAAWLWRREAVDDVGGLDERFFMYAEDIDWCRRARARGWEVRLEPAAVVRHVGNASGEQAFGAARTRTHLDSAYRWMAGVHGPAWVLAHRLLGAAGSIRLAASARLRGDRDGAASWCCAAAAHLRAGRSPRPVGALDRGASLRIALVHPYPWDEVRRGGERYLADLAWYLTGRGHRVDVLTGGRPRGTRRMLGATVRVLPRLARPSLARLGLGPVEAHGLVALPMLARRRYDLVHALVPSGALAGRLSGHRTVLTELGHPLADDLGLEGLPARLWRAAQRTATATTALGDSAADGVAAHAGRRPHVLPPGVRLDVFCPPAAPDRAVGLDPAAPTFLFPADAGGERKGLDMALAALARLRRKLDRPGAKLVVCGPGDPSWAFDRLDPADRAVLDGAVELVGVGTRDELPDRYRSATVTVLPSVNEAFGLVLVESLACGTPVVATATAGMTAIVDRPGIGTTFPPGDVDALAAAMAAAADMAADPATAARCIERARDFGWAEHVGPAHEQLYRSILSRRRRAPEPARTPEPAPAPRRGGGQAGDER
jgi:GT2 family glycosyltransferase/glycosyltransferase involved in cell wall biosynthesis